MTAGMMMPPSLRESCLTELNLIDVSGDWRTLSHVLCIASELPVLQDEAHRVHMPPESPTLLLGIRTISGNGSISSRLGINAVILAVRLRKGNRDARNTSYRS